MNYPNSSEEHQNYINNINNQATTSGSNNINHNNQQQQEVVANNNNNNRVCHSRGASSVSACLVSGKELCHSRGASTDGSIMDNYTSSATESRRGTYSEAGTLPIGTVPEG